MSKAKVAVVFYSTYGTNLTMAQTAADAAREPPHSAVDYPPRYLGTRPAYGFFARRATGVALANVSLGLYGGKGGEADGRPAVMLEWANVSMDGLRAARGGASGAVSYDVGLRQGTQGCVVANSPGVVVKQVQNGSGY